MVGGLKYEMNSIHKNVPDTKRLTIVLLLATREKFSDVKHSVENPY